MKYRITDRGEATAQAVIAVPVVLLILWTTIQVTIFLHGANVADAAANEGAAAAARYGSSPRAGEHAIEAMLSALGASRSHDSSVTLSGNQSIARVTIKVPRVVPFFPGHVTRTAYEPIERFRSEDSR